MGKRRAAVFDPEVDTPAEKKRGGGKKAKQVDSAKEVNAVVAKKLRDNFKGWSSVALDGVLHDKLTIRQTVTRDYHRHLADPNNFKMGATYYANLKILFKSADPSGRKLVAKHPEQTVSPSLLAAMKETQQYHRNMQPLLTQLQLMDRCNQKELVGILKFNESLNPSVSQMQWSTSIAIATYCAKHSMSQHFPAEMEVAKPQWDRAFVAAFESLHRDGIEIATFVDRYKAPLQLVANIADMKTLVERHGPWTSVRDALNRVVGSSEVGKRMFSFAMVHIIAHETSATIDEEVRQHFAATPNSTVENIAALKQKVVGLVNGKVGVDLLPSKRMVSVVYRAVSVKIPVDSIFDEVDKKVAAKLKSLAVAVGELQPLLCELELVPRIAEAHTIHKDLLEPFAIARSQANNMFGAYPWSSGEELVEKLVEKQQSLFQLDSTFIVELEFMKALSGDEGDALLHKDILRCLPAESRLMSPPESAEALKALQGSERVKYAGSGAKGSLAIVQDIVGHLVMKLPPPLSSATGNAFYHEVVQSLAFFMTLDLPPAAEGPAKLFGRDALAKNIEEIDADVARDEAAGVSFDKLTDLNIFGFLLRENERAKVGAWLKSALQSITVAPLAPSSVAHKSPSAEKAATNKKARKQSAADVAKSFFD